MKDDKKLKGAAGTDWDNSSEVTSIKPGTNITITNDGLGSPVIGVKIPDLAAGVYTSANITISDGGFISKIVSGSSITAGVTSVTQGTSGTIAVTGDDNVNPVLDLTKMQNAGNTFAYPSSITTDDYGRTSVVIAGTAPITNITSTTLDVNNTATPSTIELQTIADVAGDYTSLNATVNAHGIITKASSGGSIPTLNSKYIIAAADTTLPNAENLGALSSGLLMNTVTGGVATLSSAVKGTDYLSGVQEGSGIKLTAGDNPTISIANTTVTAADYTNANLSIGADGRITAASNGTSGITSITEGIGVTVDNITTPISPIISLKTVGTAGTFTNPSITVNNTGQITNATNGTTPNLTAKYIVQSSDSTLTNSQSLGALTSGLLKNTVTSGTGILSSATAGTDYISGIAQGSGLTVSTGAVPTIGITTITGVANTYAYPSSVVVNNLGQTTSVTAGVKPIIGINTSTQNGLMAWNDTTGTSAKNSGLTIDTTTGNLSLGTHKITDVVDCVNPQDAGTKNYIDTAIATAIATFRKNFRTGTIVVGDVASTSRTLVTTGSILTAAMITPAYTSGSNVDDSFVTLTFADAGYIPLVFLTWFDPTSSSTCNDIYIFAVQVVTNTSAKIYIEENPKGGTQNGTLHVFLVNPSM